MIVTTNNILEEKELDDFYSVDALVDCILTGNRKPHSEEIPGSDRKNSVEKFFILAIHPSIQASKSLMNTLALGAKFQELAKSIEDYESNSFYI